jgi:hypothetical protein
VNEFSEQAKRRVTASGWCAVKTFAEEVFRMLRRAWLGVVGLVFVAIALVAATQGQEVSLRLKFSPKQIRIYEHQVSGESSMTMKPPGQQEVSFTTKLEGKVNHRERIDDVDKDGVAAVTMTVSGSLKFEAKGLPEGPQMPPEIEIQPISVRFKVNPRGKVSEVRMDIDELRNRPPVPAPISMLQMQGTSWQGLLLPEKPVKVGDSWDVTSKVDFKLEDRTLEFEVKGKARLAALEKLDGRDCAVIEVTAELPDTGKLFSELAPVPEMRENISAKIEGQVAGKFWLNIVDGLIVRSETNGKVNVTVTFKTPTGESFTMLSKGSFKDEQRLVKVEQEK